MLKCFSYSYHIKNLHYLVYYLCIGFLEISLAHALLFPLVVLFPKTVRNQTKGDTAGCLQFYHLSLQHFNWYETRHTFYSERKLQYFLPIFYIGRFFKYLNHHTLFGRFPCWYLYSNHQLNLISSSILIEDWGFLHDQPASGFYIYVNYVNLQCSFISTIVWVLCPPQGSGFQLLILALFLSTVQYYLTNFLWNPICIFVKWSQGDVYLRVGRVGR